MGFFATSGPTTAKKSYSPQVCHTLECKICPLNRMTEQVNDHPAMDPTGAKHPEVYILGEAPGAEEDEKGRQFVGASGKVLRYRIPKEWNERIRWNNVVRTRPPDNRPPTDIEIECCRPSIERDIARTKPRAIFGFGAVPLAWGPRIPSGISMWRGRKTPVNIGGHRCWFYVFHHPSYIHRLKKFDKSPGVIGSEEERAFTFDIERAFEEIAHLDDPIVYDAKMAEAGVEILNGSPGDLERLEELIDWACELKEAGVDYETFRTRPYHVDAKILTISVGTPDRSFAFAYDHPGARWTSEQKKKVRKLWIKFLKSDCRKWVHFLNFEMEWTAYFFGWSLLRDGKWGGTESQASVLDERTGKEKRKTKQGPFQLDFLTKQYFGLNIKILSPLDKKDLRKEPIKEVLRYNGIDAKFHMLLAMAQRKWLKHYDLMHVYKAMVRKTPTVVLTQLKGIPINLKITKDLFDQFTEEADDAKLEFMEDTDAQEFARKNKKFNIKSNNDIVKFYRDFLKFNEGFTEGKYDEKLGERKKKYSTDKEVLNKIDHPTAPVLLRFREVDKKLTTYCYHEHVYPDGLLHAIFNTIFTTTSRLSCDSPNLQNIPKRNKESKKLRRQIQAPPGHSIVAIDYGQIEWRVIAMITKAKAMVQALWENYDVHGHWAKRLSKAYPQALDQFSDQPDPLKRFRDDVKNQWTFPLCFGAQLESVSEYLHIPDYILKPEHKRFMKEFSEVFQWHEELNKFYKDNGYVETLNGFRRRAPLSFNKVINSPVQGTAAEIVLDGMSRISEHANRINDWYFQPNINIHDDLTFFWPDEKIDHYANEVIDMMVNVPFKFVNVPIVVELSIGKNFYEMGKDKEKDTLVVSSHEWKKAA